MILITMMIMIMLMIIIIVIIMIVKVIIVMITMGSNDLVVGEDHMLGPSCQRCNWQTGRCGSMAFGSSPR